MRKQKLKRRYSRKRSGPRGRRLSEVCVIDENDTWIVDTILRHFPGIFQNIHDSFDEIDSKTLNNVYRKSTQQPARDKSGEPLTTICPDPWCDTKHCHQDPASGRRTPPGLSPAPPWQRRWVYSIWTWTRAWRLLTIDPWPCVRWMVRRWHPPPPSIPCVTAAWGRGAQSLSGSKQGESAARNISIMIRKCILFSGKSKSSSVSWISLELRRVVNQMLDFELRKVFYHQASSISPTMKTLTSYLWHLLQQWLTICFRLTSMLII